MVIPDGWFVSIQSKDGLIVIKKIEVTILIVIRDESL